MQKASKNVLENRGEPNQLTLVEATQALREGTLTSEALTSSCLGNIARFDSTILAWAWLDHAIALEKARAADRLLKKGTSHGKLHGIPIAVKDIIFTEGIPTSMGSPIFDDFVPDCSATCVKKLEDSGAFVLGKTVSTEFASQHPGKTRNPWDSRFTPGGSSSGSAAAVAARSTPAALGSQTRGSTIRPAVYCGVVGYKPSFGLISRYGVNPLSSTLDHVGVIARTVDDAALLASCMIGHDPLDPGSAQTGSSFPDLMEIRTLERPPRLAAVRSPLWHLVEQPQRELFLANQRVLKKAGAQVNDLALPSSFDHALDVAKVIQLAEIAHSYSPLVARYSDLISERFHEFVDQGSRFSAVSYLDALRSRDQLCRELAVFFGDYDAIITPPATGEPPQTLEFTGDANLCTIWTLCGVPAISIPTGVGPNNMPMGLQVVGPHLKDYETLQVAKWCAARLVFPRQWPK